MKSGKGVVWIACSLALIMVSPSFVGADDQTSPATELKLSPEAEAVAEEIENARCDDQYRGALR